MRLLPAMLPAALSLALTALPTALLAETAPERILPLPGEVPVMDPASGWTFELEKVTDQRCPADVQCYWEGLILLEISVTGPDAKPQQIVLCNLCDEAKRTASLDGVTLRLSALTPSTEKLAMRKRGPILSDYIAEIGLTGP